MMRISYKLTKRTTKTEKVEKSLKILKCIISNFNTALYKMTASGNIIHSIINYKLMRSVGIFRLLKE